VLFLADGYNGQGIGFKRQWTVAHDAEAFVFAGVINQTELNDRQKTLLCDWLAELVPAFHLKGLNSLDFLQDGEDLWILEINPRPPASMQLYAGDLLSCHIRNQLSNNHSPQHQASAYQIVYAPYDITIPPIIKWPQGCVDIPTAGVICRKSQPICSIIALQKTAQKMCEQLQYWQRDIFQQLGVSSHNLPA